MKVNSVLGPIETKEMGTTLMHEHVACYDWSMRMSFGKRWMDPEKLVVYAGNLLKNAREKFGIQTMVDGSAANIGRDIKMIKAVAEYSGVNIIVSSGMYFNEEPFLLGKPAQMMADVLIDECENGIEDTVIKPGILKCATDVNGITPINHMLLDAISIVQKKTNLPLFAHSAPTLGMGILQQAIFKSHGVDLSRVIIGHSDDTDNIEYLEKLLKAGSYLGMDRIGIGSAVGVNSKTLEERVNTIYELCKRGWIDKLFLSQDTCPYIDWGAYDWSIVDNPDSPLYDFDYTYLHRKAIPLLLEKGLTQSDIDHMMIDNPRTFFEGK